MGIVLYLCSMVFIIFLHHFFRKEGLFLFITLAGVLANLQSLKAIKLYFFKTPLAGGTILFTLSLFATDILAEFYGKKEAVKGIWLGFTGMLMTSIIMMLNLYTTVLPADPGSPYYPYVEAHQAMVVLFSPVPALFLASIISYLISQYLDMHFFIWLKKNTPKNQLGFRSLTATFLSAGIDNCIFSVLAWKLFYPLQMDLKSFISSYIIGTLALRFIISIANIPFFYLINFRVRKKMNVSSISSF